MITFLLLTAFTVSIDSFFCGFSLSFVKGKKYLIVLLITLTVFVMCVTVNYLSLLFSDFINDKTACFGGIILVVIGLINLFSRSEKKIKSSDKGLAFFSLASGFAVGLDGAGANLSLSIMGLNSIFVPITIALMHGFMISAGILLSKTKLFSIFNKFSFLPPLILIALGIYKLLGLFI